MTTAVLLGLLQGTLEWLPVSSQGAIATVFLVLDRPEGLGFALWLHVGTVPSVLVAFRSEVWQIARELATRPTRPSKLATYLVVATVVSGAIGLPLLLGLEELFDRYGSAAMGLVGAMLLVTGAVQLRRREVGVRTRDDLSKLDGVLAGVSQGVAALPGISRSGMTVAVLLWRRLDRREALVVSFLMSVPVSLGAAVYAGFDSEFTVSGETLVAAAVAFVTGLATLRVLVAFAARINFAVFVMLVGLAILGGAAWLAIV